MPLRPINRKYDKYYSKWNKPAVLEQSTHRFKNFWGHKLDKLVIASVTS